MKNKWQVSTRLAVYVLVVSCYRSDKQSMAHVVVYSWCRFWIHSTFYTFGGVKSLTTICQLNMFKCSIRDATKLEVRCCRTRMLFGSFKIHQVVSRLFSGCQLAVQKLAKQSGIGKQRKRGTNVPIFDLKVVLCRHKYAIIPAVSWFVKKSIIFNWYMYAVYKNILHFNLHWNLYSYLHRFISRNAHLTVAAFDDVRHLPVPDVIDDDTGYIF